MSSSCCSAGPQAAAQDDGGPAGTSRSDRTPTIPSARYRRGAGLAAGAADRDVRLRRRAVRQGRQGPLRPGRAASARRWSICPASPATSCVDTRTGGDLSVQACADDPQVAFHAVRQLARLAYGVARSALGAGRLSSPAFGQRQTPRNLMGFKDGTNNPAVDDSAGDGEDSSGSATRARPGCAAAAMSWSRRIRMALEHWDRMKVDFQEQTFGRHKYSGAPLGGKGRVRPARSRRQPTRTATRSFPRARMSGSPLRRATTARRSCAGPIPTMTA